jgi:integrase
MQGGVRKRGASWSYYFDIGTKRDGKRKIKEKSGFASRPEAVRALTDALYEYNNGGYVAPKDMKFYDFCAEWLDDYIKNFRKVSTYNRYNELINKYIKDNIGNININDIEAYNIEKFLLKIKAKKDEDGNPLIGGTTLQAIFTLTNTIMNRAVKLKILRDNPCKYVERPRRDKFTPDVLDINDINAIYKALDINDEYNYLFYMGLKITLELGLRRGELGGLEWKDIDYKNNTISINNNLIYSNGHVLMSTPKTKESKREIYASDDLLNLLKDLNARQKMDEHRYGEFYSKNVFDGKEFDLVMRWENGKYIHPSYYGHKLNKCLVKANIDKHIRFHDLRHTNATLLLSQGVDFKTIQIRLGHKDINTTLNIYSHVNKEMQKSATEKLLKILNQ